MSGVILDDIETSPPPTRSHRRIILLLAMYSAIITLALVFQLLKHDTSTKGKILEHLGWHVERYDLVIPANTSLTFCYREQGHLHNNGSVLYARTQIFRTIAWKLNKNELSVVFADGDSSDPLLSRMNSFLAGLFSNRNDPPQIVITTPISTFTTKLPIDPTTVKATSSGKIEVDKDEFWLGRIYLTTSDHLIDCGFRMEPNNE